jgi:proline iminopeptidase
VQDNERFIDVNGTRLFLRIAGTGEPIIIVHGGPGMSHDYLAPQLIELLAKDYQLVFYDQRASGRSSGVDDTASLTISHFVSDLDMLRQRLKIDRLNLLGHSFGGLLAMYYAISHPDHVNKLLLIDTSPASWELNFPYFRKTIAERQTEQDRQELNTLKLKNDFTTNPAVMDRYLKIYFKPFFKDPALSQQLSLGIDKNWISHFNVTNDAVWNNLGHYDIHDKLKYIKASTLVMHGDYSVISIDGAKAIASHIPNSKLVILKDVGHFPYIEAPKEFSSAIKAFWAK